VGACYDHCGQLGPGPFYILKKDILTYEIPRVAVLQLKGQLRTRVSRAHRDYDGPGFDRSKVGDHELGAVQ